MAEAAFDTLSMARSLERDYDMPAKQAEGVATLVYTQLSGNVATKEDIARVQDDIARVQDDIAEVKTDLKAEIARLEVNMATKVDLAEVRAEIAGVESSLKTKIAGVESSLKTEIAGVRNEIAEVRTEIARSSNRQVAILGGLIGGLFVINKILPLFGS